MISVVVPLLNEEHSLEVLYAEIAAALESRSDEFEVVFVDDGSSDGSMSVLTRLHEEVSNVVVVHLRRNFGKAAALQAGFLEARGEIVVTIDADLQDDPAEIPKLLANRATDIGIARMVYGTAPFRPLAVDLVSIDPGSGSATARRQRLDEPPAG